MARTRRRKLRSPLHGARAQHIAGIRALIRAQLEWEKALGTPGQFLHADEPIDALMALTYSTVEHIRERSLRRWQQAEHFDQSYAVYLDQHLRQHDRRAWETAQLRAEVAALNARLDEVTR